MKLRSVLARSLSRLGVIDIFPLGSEISGFVTQYLPIAFPESRSVNIDFVYVKGLMDFMTQ